MAGVTHAPQTVLLVSTSLFHLPISFSFLPFPRWFLLSFLYIHIVSSSLPLSLKQLSLPCPPLLTVLYLFSHSPPFSPFLVPSSFSLSLSHRLSRPSLHSVASTPEPAPFPGDTELLSPESRLGTGAEATPSKSFIIKSSRGLSSEQKEVRSSVDHSFYPTVSFFTASLLSPLSPLPPFLLPLPPSLFTRPLCPSPSRCTRRPRGNLTSPQSSGDEGPSSKGSTSSRLLWWTPLPTPVEKSARPLF